MSNPNNAHSQFPIIVAFQLLVMVLIILFCDVKLEVSDDFVMEMILSGVYTGKNDIHLMFSNVIWACVLLPFYKFLPGVNWYILAQLLVCMLSLVAITYVLFRVQKLPSAVITSIVFTAFTAMDLYILPQFTKTAIAAVFAGSILFLWALFYGRSRLEAFFGVFLILIGSWIRMSTIYIAAPFIIVILICEIFRMTQSPENNIKALVRVAVSGASLIAVVFACSWIDNYVYAADDNYLYYRQYSQARAAVVDFPWPTYAQYEEEFREIGVSENDYLMITSWNYGDSEVYDLETLQNVGEILEEYRQTKHVSIRDFLRSFKDRQLRYPGAVLCIFLGLNCIAIDWKKAWVPISAAIICAVCFFYYFYIGREVYRVEFAYYYCAAVLIAFYSNELPCTIKNQKILFPLVSVILLLLQAQVYVPDQSDIQTGDDEYRAYVDDTFYYSWNYDVEKYSKRILEGEIRPNFLWEVREHPERLYVMEFYTTIQTLYYDFSPFDSAAASFPSNVVYLGGVTVNHPSVIDSLVGENTGSLLEKLLEENAFLVTNRAQEQIRTYFAEHGYPQIQMELYDTVDGYQIWKFSI